MAPANEAPNPWPMIGAMLLGALLLGGGFAWMNARTAAEKCARHESELRASLGPGGRIPPGDHHSFYWCPAGCEEGDANACLEVATIYASGQGYAYPGGVDYDKAREYAARACAVGDRGCVLAEKYACLADTEACADRCTFSGEVEACATLVDSLSKPNDWPRDLKAAEQVAVWLRAACAVDPAYCPRAHAVACAPDLPGCAERCEAGEAHACKALGDLFASGELSVREDAAKASRFRVRACQLDTAIEPDCATILLDTSPG